MKKESLAIKVLKKINIIWFIIAIVLCVSSGKIFVSSVKALAPSLEKHNEFINKINNIDTQTAKEKELKNIILIREKKAYDSLNSENNLMMSLIDVFISGVSGMFFLLFLWGVSFSGLVISSQRIPEVSN